MQGAATALHEVADGGDGLLHILVGDDGMSEPADILAGVVEVVECAVEDGLEVFEVFLLEHGCDVDHRGCAHRGADSQDDEGDPYDQQQYFNLINAS